jgi:hypothetical protein
VREHGGVLEKYNLKSGFQKKRSDGNLKLKEDIPEMVIHESDNSLEYVSLYLNDLRVRMLEENC